MSERIPQSVSKIVVFRAYLTSDGKTLATGKTIAITISKNGGAFGNPNAGATNATEISSGFYKFTLDTTDTATQGPLAWRGAEGTIDDAGDCYSVVNATNAGFSALPNAAADAAGGLPISDAGGLDLDAQIGTKINDILTDTGATLDTKLNTAQADLDILTGTDGVTLATAQANYAPLKPTTADRTLDVSAAGNAGIDWGNVENPTTTVNLSGTTIATLTGHTPQTGDSYARLGAPVGVSISADIAGVAFSSSNAAFYAAQIGQAGNGLSEIPWNANWDAEVQSEVADALADYDGPTKAEMDAGFDAVPTAAENAAAIDKTGYKLASDGLDSVATTAPTGVASNFREMVVQTWRRFFKKTVYDIDDNNIKTFADNGSTVITTQTVAVSATEETQGAAS